MKSKEVLRILGVTRVTLMNLVKRGVIGVVPMPNGRYDYSSEDVYKYKGKGFERYNALYARVSTAKQKKDLANQVALLESFCAGKGEIVGKVFEDIASGISFDKRNAFFSLLDDVLDNKVSKVFITYKDRLSRVGFSLFKHLFAKYGTDIVVINESNSDKLDSEEVFEDIVNLLDDLPAKHYSSRKIKDIKKILVSDDTNESLENETAVS